MRVSVIVPVYNAEVWLEKCVKSILNQSYAFIEIILVDDKSSDSSTDICRSLAQNYDSIVYYQNNTNIGANRSRQKGVELSHGEYIMFVDSDDSIPQDCISNLVRFTDNSDIVIGVKWDTNEDNRVLTAEQWRNQCAEGGLLMSPIAKLYRRTLFDETVFDIPSYIRVCEDDIMNLRLSQRNQKDVVLFLEQKSYEYNQNEGSVTSKWRWSIDRFSEVYDVIFGSIPEDQLHLRMRSLIERRLTSLRVLYESAGNVTDVSDFANHPYLARLKGDIRDYKFKVPLGVAVTLKMPQSSVPICYYKARRFFLILQQKISRMIGR